MKRNITKIFAALALLLFIAPLGMWGQTMVASFSRSGTTDNVTGGTFSAQASAQSGYYQDGSGTNRYLQILNNSAYWTSTPTSISFTAKIGGGTGNKDLSNPVYVTLLDASGNEIASTQTVITSHITTNTGDNYTISLPVTNNIYGVKVSHVKETGYNVRYYSFSLSYVGGSAPSTYTVTYNCNGADSGCPNPATITGIEPGTTITLEDGPVKDGYEFAGWSDGTTTYDEGEEYEVNSNVTFTAQWTEVVSADEQWVLTSLADLTSTDVFVIVGNNGSNYAMKNTTENSGPVAIPVTVSGNKLTGTVSSDIKWNISGNATNGYIFYPNGSTSTWLYCNNDNNGLRIGSGNTDYNTFELKSDYIYNKGRTRYIGVYSSTNWRSYTSINNNIKDQTFAFYKKVNGVTPPSISANNVSIAYGETNGSISYTINDAPTPAGSLSADINAGGTIANLQIGTITNSAVSFTCDANTESTARTATVTLTYTYGNNQTVTQTVTITQAAAPMTYTTIPALFAAATTTETPVYVTFGNWVVSGISTDGKNVFVTDNNGNGFVIYFTSDMSGTFAEGNILSGTAVPCSLKKYNGYADLLNLDANDLTIATGGTVSTADIALASLTGVNTGALVHYEGLTCSVTTNQAGTSTYYNLSDGTTTIQVYNSLYAFEPLEDGAIYNITGIYQQYNSYKEINPRSAADIVKVTTPVINAAANTLSIAYNETAGEIDYTITNPVQDENLTATPSASWITSISVLSNKVTFSTTENDGQAARTATITLSYEGAEAVDVTVTQGVYAPGASTGGDYVRISSLDQLTDGSVVVIAARRNEDDASEYAAMPNVASGKPTGVNFTSTTSNGDEILPASIVDEISDYYWTVNVTTDGYSFTNTNGEMIGYPSSGTDFTTGQWANTNWTIAREVSGDAAMVAEYAGFVVRNTSTNTRAIAYNGDKFGAYSTTANINASGYNFYLDFFVEMSAVSEYTLDIDGYNTGTGKYYLIASPVECVTPSADNGFIQVGDGLAYDLYRFDQGQEDEWLNYKTTPFNLLSGHGYLYASKTDTQLTFTGTAYSGDGQVSLSKVSGASWEGWNLIGNPFGNTAVLKDANNANMAFYKMNGTGTEIITGTLGADIATMEGVFVVAANNGDVVTFVPSNNGKSAQLSINVNNGTANVDRAIVRFDNGSQLPKFQLNPNNTKVYITEGDQDYAVVRSANQGEMPVSFKAGENGTYTISANAENMEMTYLHLIDNMTGADVDLLATPSYTFDARTTDYTSRFRLVFNGNSIDENTTETETFAFFNGESWSVSNQGEATLQVVDVMGRIVNTQNINGNAAINLNETPGIYMLRLVNGNNVKVQKIVVR